MLTFLPLQLSQLLPNVVYNVMQDSSQCDSSILSGHKIQTEWRASRDIQKFRDDEPMPMGQGGYLRVQCDIGVSIAVWRDPSRPELAGSSLEQVPPAGQQPAVRPEPGVEGSLSLAATALKQAMSEKLAG
jgi:hypothetical protein